MAGFGIGEISSFFVILALCLSVVIAWIMKSEASRRVFKQEIRKLRGRIEDAERENFMLSEEAAALKELALSSGSAQGAGQPVSAEGADKNKVFIKMMVEKTESLEEENARLRNELSEARSSLEEVYKALCE